MSGFGAVYDDIIGEARASVLRAVFRDPRLSRLTSIASVLEADLEDPVGLRMAILMACRDVGIVDPAEASQVVRDAIGAARAHECDVRTLRTAAELQQCDVHAVATRLRCGCSAIDKGLLNGGFQRGCITEVTGEAGTGKSHLALQALLFSACQRLLQLLQAGESATTEAGDPIPLALYVVSENSPAQRMAELAEAASRESGLQHEVGLGGDDVLAHVLVSKIGSGFGALSETLDSALRLAKRPEVVANVGVFALDSIAACLSAPEAAEPSAKRMQTSAIPASSAAQTLRIGAKLKAVAAALECAVIVVNQVRATGFDDTRPPGDRTRRLEAPALGNSWATCVATRIHLRAERVDSVRRTAAVTLSAHLPLSSVQFKIVAEGIANVSGAT